MCQNAKTKRRDEESKESWLDFQLILEGATENITNLRHKNYTSVQGEPLWNRPYEVMGEYNTWTDFIKRLKEIQQWPRSRAKALLKALSEGEESAKNVYKQCEFREYTVHNTDLIKLFDVLEMFDFYWDGDQH